MRCIHGPSIEGETVGIFVFLKHTALAPFAIAPLRALLRTREQWSVPGRAAGAVAGYFSEDANACAPLGLGVTNIRQASGPAAESRRRAVSAGLKRSRVFMCLWFGGSGGWEIKRPSRWLPMRT